jgi:hypothetical protein
LIREVHSRCEEGAADPTATVLWRDDQVRHVQDRDLRHLADRVVGYHDHSDHVTATVIDCDQHVTVRARHHVREPLGQMFNRFGLEHASAERAELQIGCSE